MADRELEDLVARDIEVGLAGGSAETDEAPRQAIFAPIDGVDFSQGELPGVTVRTVDRNRAAVEWTYRCQHVGHFAGIMPTDKTLVIHGVTIVERRPDREPRFRRYVDWAEVMTQLGVTATFRPSFESVDEIPGFGSIVLDPDAKKGEPRSRGDAS
jgi:hypothetical protein